MTNWTKLKKAIADVIKTNGNQEITGAIMQHTLISIVDNLGDNAQFGGVAVPSTVPADTDGSLFYLAATQGTYPNFNNIEVDASEMAVFTKDTAGTWVKTSLPIQHPTIKKPLLIGGNVAAVTKGTGVVLSVPTLNTDGMETASELSIEAATSANNGAMTKDQVNTLKEVDDFYTRMTDFVIGDNDDRALLKVETTQQNSVYLKYKTLDTITGGKAEETKAIPAVSPGNGVAGVAGMDLVHDIPYFFDFYESGFTSLADGSDISKVLLPKFQTSYNFFEDLYTDVPAIQNKVFANPKAGDRILIGSLSGVPVDTAPLWATVTSAQRISGVYSVTVDYDGDTYIFAYTSSNDMATLEVPWTKISPKRNVYANDLKQLSPEYGEARIKDYLTPQVYRAYNIVYPVKPQTGDLMEEVLGDDESRFIPITALRNREDPDEYTDILIPESGTANAYTRIVLKNDLTVVKSYNPYYILKTCKRAYNGDLLLALDTVKAETVADSISDAYSFSIEGRNTQLAAQLPEVGDLIQTRDATAPVCEVLLSDDVQHTRWFHNGKLYEVLVNTALTRVPEDPKVVYDTTSGTLRDLYVSAGAKYNEATGFYELNGLTDITEEQMRVIYEKTWGWWIGLPNLNGFGDASARTNIPCPDYKRIYYQTNCNLGSAFGVTGNLGNLEVLNFIPLRYPNESLIRLSIRTMNWMCQGNAKPLIIMGTFDVGNVPDNNSLNIGGNIKTINIKNLSKNIRFYNSKVLSKESVLYMINNSEATRAITIGLQQAVYDVMKDDADIIAALAEKTNITLIQNT
jgi:hypothetical protein